MDSDLERYLASKGWNWKAVEGGRQIRVEDECPFCGKKKHLYFSAATTKWDCKVCGETGNLLTMKRRLGDLTINVRSAADIFYRGAKDRAPPLSGERPTNGIDKTFQQHLTDNTAPEVLEYVLARGFTEETIQRFRLGVAVKNSRFLLSIPHYYDGELVGIKFRTVPPDKKKFSRWRDCPSVLFNGDCLRGLKDEAPCDRKVFICEGETDAMALAQLGYQYVVASTTGAGKVDWPAHWLIPLEPATAIYLVYDADQAGENGALKAATALGRYRCHRVVPPLHDCARFVEAGFERAEFDEAVDAATAYDDSAVRSTSAFADDLRSMLASKQPRGRPTGWVTLDITMGGIRDGELTVITGETGCLAGDTEIGFNRAGNGKRQQLAELVRRQNGGAAGGKVWRDDIPTLIQSVVEPGYWGLAQIVRAVDAGEQETVDVEFSNGSKLVGTEDHKVMTPEGEWLALGELALGSSVACKAATRTSRRKKLMYRQIGGLKYHPHATHPNVKNNRHRVPYHRLVYEAEMNGLPVCRYIAALRTDASGLRFLPRNMLVHHKDRDPTNNELLNLEALTDGEHKVRHAIEDEAWKHFGLNQIGACSVVSVKASGKLPTYDLTVAGTHNYIANGIVTHNSGKSTFGTALARSQALQDATVMIAPFEQPCHEILGKLVAMEAGQPIYDMDAVDLEAGILKTLQRPVYFLDRRGPTPFGEIKDAIYLAVQRFGVRFVLLDHLHFFLEYKDDNERQTIDQVMRALKVTAEDLAIHIALVVHPAKLGRDHKGRVRKATLDDLKGSSEIKKVPDLGIRVWRDRKGDTGSKADDVEIAVLKCRSTAGREGACWFSFDPDGERYIDSSPPRRVRKAKQAERDEQDEQDDGEEQGKREEWGMYNDPH